MPPSQGSPQPSVDPYAFLNETQKPSFSLFGMLNSSSFSKKIIGVIGGGVVLILLIFGLKTLFGGSSGVNMQSLYEVLGQQQELINLSTTGSQQTNASPSYLNFSATTLASVTTDNNKLIKLLGLNHIKVSPKNYILQPQVDAQLTQAITVSNFDPVYGVVLQNQLKLYQNDLSSAYNLNKSSLLKSYFETDYKEVNLLLTMLKSSYN